MRALRDVSLELAAGETLGLVGESGSGKTTLAQVLLGLTAAGRGRRVELDGRACRRGSAAAARRDQVKALQIVFQNPDSALNRRAHGAATSIGRALTKLAGPARQRARGRAASTRGCGAAARPLSRRANRASSPAGSSSAWPSPGRSPASPRVVVCDEPTSALDVSVQAAILNLLADLQARASVSAYIFISHDLGVVRYLADRIAVLYLGRIMEIGPAEAVFAGPHHPYTEALLSAVPDARAADAGARIRLQGEIPSALKPPSGCVFHTRCPRKLGRICESEEPALHVAEPGHVIRCHIPAAELMIASE